MLQSSTNVSINQLQKWNNNNVTNHKRPTVLKLTKRNEHKTKPVDRDSQVITFQARKQIDALKIVLFLRLEVKRLLSIIRWITRVLPNEEPSRRINRQKEIYSYIYSFSDIKKHRWIIIYISQVNHFTE